MKNHNKHYLSGKVTRWHTNFGVYPQTNADHQHGVANLILEYHPEPSLNLLKAALNHDVGEYGVGDVKSPAKKKNSKLKDLLDEVERDYRTEISPIRLTFGLDDQEKLWLAWADSQEALFFLDECQQKQFIPEEEYKSLLIGCRKKAQDLLLSIFNHYPNTYEIMKARFS